MDKTSDKANDFEYTMILDPGSSGEDAQARRQTEAEAVDKAVERIRTVAEDPAKTMDSLYEAYEKMCFREPTVLDKDDIYPHSYQWRTGGRYSAAKFAVLTEAVKQGKRIIDTDAYQKYVEVVTRRKFKPDSWD